MTKGIEAIAAALKAYDDRGSTHYDEVLDEVAQRIRASGSVGKLDVGALVAWKRLRADTRPMASFMGTPDSEVRAVTASVVAAARDFATPVPEAAGRARSAFGRLPLFVTGDAIASAVITAAAPDRMAVYDRRAHAALKGLGYDLTNRPGRYGAYMDIIESIRADWPGESVPSARRIDLALYQLGGQSAESL